MRLADFLGIKGYGNYGHLNTYDLAKFFAIFIMIIDHVGNFFLPETYYLRGIGRMAFPIFFFLIGYSRKYNFSLNFLVIGAIITIFKGGTLGQWAPFDILLTAFLVKLAMSYLEKKNQLNSKNYLFILLAGLIWHIGLVWFISYGSIGLYFAILGALKRKNNEVEEMPYLNTYIIITLGLDIFLQSILWDDAKNFQTVFFIGSLLLCFYFSSFKVKEVAFIKNKVLSSFISLVGRNSLFIYWLHITIFIYLSVKILTKLYI
jgi:hypothetical protein